MQTKTNIKSEFDDAIKDAFIENTAQAIFDEIQKIDSYPEKYRQRWVWELLQNASDAADAKKVEVLLESVDKKFIVKHDGSPFTLKELAHLILRGSTKRKAGHGIGKFGVGFISTHVLSKNVSVRGLLENGQYFTTTIDRNVASPEELESKMKKALEEVVKSLQMSPNIEPKFTTECIYHLEDEQAAESLSVGIQNLKDLISFVLVFNNRIRSIKFKKGGEEQVWVRLDEKTEHSEAKQIVTVGCYTSDAQPTYQRFAVITGEPESEMQVQVAIPLLYQENNIIDIANVPKLFVLFPLSDTASFPFPVVINSPYFEPQPDRDGIFLGSVDSPKNLIDKKLLKFAAKSYRQLVKLAVGSEWKNTHYLARIPNLPDKGWIDKQWLKEFIRTEIIEPIRQDYLLQTVDGKNIPSSKAWIPVVKHEEARSWLWRCASAVFADRVPEESVSVEWSMIIQQWKEYLNKEIEDINEALTIEKFALSVSDFGSIDKLREYLQPADEANLSAWLNDFLGLVNHYSGTLFDSLSLLPNQKGIFRVRNKVWKDLGIEEELKEYAEGLSWDIRSELLDSRVDSKIAEEKCFDEHYTQESVVSNLLQKVKDQAKTRASEESYQKANRGLFVWLITKRHGDLLKDGFPFLTRRFDEGQENIIGYSTSEEKLLAPSQLWPEEAAQHEGVIPSEFVLSASYAPLLDRESWELVAAHEILRAQPLFVEKKSLGKVDLDRIVEGEELGPQDHSAEIEVSRIAFLEKKDKGILDLARKSKERSKKLLRFLFDYAIKMDEVWSRRIEVGCECGKPHRICPAEWLGFIKKRYWIPTEKKDRYSTPSVEALARLFEDDVELQQKLQDMTVLKFLDRIQIGGGEILRYVGGKDEETRLAAEEAVVKIFLATSADPEELKNIADAIADPDLRAKLEQWQANKGLIHRNQKIGTHVEELLEKVLRTPEFHLERTGIGSDFEVVCDFISDGQEQMFKVGNTHIEVKSTHENEIRMTPTQAKMAVDLDDNFVLCVVEVPEVPYNIITSQIIREKVRFVTGIGSKLKGMVENAGALSEAQKQLCSESGEIEVVMDGPIVRYKVNKRVWEGGMTLDQFERHLYSKIDKMFKK